MNLATDVMLGIKERLGDFEKQVQKYATEPYGQRKLTPAEELHEYKSLTPEKFYEKIQTMDYNEFKQFNKWLFKMEQKETKNA